MTSYLKYNNQEIKYLIDASLPINKYFKLVNNCIQYVNDGKMPYFAAQVIHKGNRAVLESGFYVDTCNEQSKYSCNHGPETHWPADGTNPPDDRVKKDTRELDQTSDRDKHNPGKERMIQEKVINKI